jgi:methionine aminopeptidase type I
VHIKNEVQNGGVGPVIEIKSDKEIEILRVAGRINATVHQRVREWLVPGKTTLEVDQELEKLMIANGGKSSFRSVGGFPGATCISVNECIGHGVPGGRVLSEGDVVKVDVGVEYKGYHSDAAATYIIGQGSASTRRLVNTTRNALWAGIRCAEVGRRLSDVSSAVCQHVVENGFTVVRHAFGHGVGVHLHEDPQIASFGPAGCGPRIRAGMVLAIEPVVVTGSRFTFTMPDGWTTRTLDGLMGAHFEHTILITDSGPEVLTGVENSGKPARASEVTDSLLMTMSSGSNTFSIREKTSADEDEMLRLAQAQMNGILMEAWGRPVQPKEVLSPTDAITMVIVDGTGALAGFFTWSGQHAFHLNTLVLDTQYQGIGLGAMVMQRLEQTACSRGYDAVELWVQTNNTRAVRFYEKSGYQLFSKPYYNTIAMRKSLENTGADV